jgi:hypothetical protein
MQISDNGKSFEACQTLVDSNQASAKPGELGTGSILIAHA